MKPRRTPDWDERNWKYKTARVTDWWRHGFRPLAPHQIMDIRDCWKWSDLIALARWIIASAIEPYTDRCWVRLCNWAWGDSDYSFADTSQNSDCIRESMESRCGRRCWCGKYIDGKRV